MKRIFLLLLVYMPLFGKSQHVEINQGIIWANEASLKQVIEKARQENKYIFLDCFATWCRPCKMMDAQVFTNDSIGKFFNEKFISVKVQIDSTKNDSKQIRDWYLDADGIEKQFNINAFPTQVFLSPTGQLVLKSQGYKDVKDLLESGQNALNPNMQYYLLIGKFNDGTIEHELMPQLARTANYLGEKNVANRVAISYIDYLLKNTNADLFSKNNISFIKEFTTNSKNPGFDLFYREASKINRIIGVPNYSQDHICYIISKEEIDPIFKKYVEVKEQSPDWSKITETIALKYNKSYAKRSVIEAKMRWYNWKMDHQVYAKNVVLYVEQFGDEIHGLALNNYAWDVFRYSTNRKELKKACKWIKRVLDEQLDPFTLRCAMDTYANLLYKTGNVEDAIKYEQEVLDLSILNKVSEIERKTYEEALSKMKSGIPTWGKTKLKQ